MRFSELEDLAKSSKKRFCKEISKQLNKCFDDNLSSVKTPSKDDLKKVKVKEYSDDLVSLSEKIITGALLSGFFNCRTSFRAVYDFEIKNGTTKLINTPMKNISFKAQEGFDGQTLATGAWWKMSKAMRRRAKKYGLMNEFDVVLESVEETLREIYKAQKRELSKTLEQTIESGVQAFPKNKQRKVKKIIKNMTVTVNSEEISHYVKGAISLRNAGNTKTFMHQLGHAIDSETL